MLFVFNMLFFAPCLALSLSLPAPRVRSCSCGSVKLFVNSPVLHTVHCHCAGCRASTGAAFSTWGCVPLVATHFAAWSSLKVHQRQTDSQTRANRFFCSECGCTVAMNYPANGRWPEPNTLWLSAAFLGDDPQQFGEVIHMYPEERPAWCTIDPVGCDAERMTYMGGEHQCVVRYEEPAGAVLQLGGRAGRPSQDAAAVLPVPPEQCFRLRGVAPLPAALPASAVFAEDTPAWVLCEPCSGAGTPPQGVRVPSEP